MRIARRSPFCLVLPLLGLGQGCVAPDRAGDAVSRTVSLADAEQRDHVWQVCQDVLRAHGFRLDRVDRRSGLLSTHPETSQQFFEFWRRDVATPHDLWEATVRTVRRSATVTIDHDDAAAVASITVKVSRERFATTERQYNNSIAAFRMFGDELPQAPTGQPITAALDYWIPDGRDLAMERRLLDGIVAGTADSSAAAPGRG